MPADRKRVSSRGTRPTDILVGQHARLAPILGRLWPSSHNFVESPSAFDYFQAISAIVRSNSANFLRRQPDIRPNVPAYSVRCRPLLSHVRYFSSERWSSGPLGHKLSPVKLVVAGQGRPSMFPHQNVGRRLANASSDVGNLSAALAAMCVPSVVLAPQGKRRCLPVRSARIYETRKMLAWPAQGLGRNCDDSC